MNLYQSKRLVSRACDRCWYWWPCQHGLPNSNVTLYRDGCCCQYRYVYWSWSYCCMLQDAMRLIHHSNKIWTTFLRSWLMLSWSLPLLLCSGCLHSWKIHLVSCWLCCSLPLQPFHTISCYRYHQFFSWYSSFGPNDIPSSCCQQLKHLVQLKSSLLIRLVRWLWQDDSSKKSSTMVHMTQLMILNQGLKCHYFVQLSCQWYENRCGR